MIQTETEKYEFQKVDGTVIDDVIEYIHEQIIYAPNAQVYLGVDSKVKATKTYYAIVIGIYFPGKGAHIIHAKKFGPKHNKDSIQQRLRQEVDYAVDVGLYLSNHLSRGVTVHVDISPNPKNKSNFTYNYANGYLKGTGLPFAVKPDAFMAMRAADFLTYADRY